MLIIKLSAPLGNYANDAPTTYISRKRTFGLRWSRTQQQLQHNSPTKSFCRRLRKRRKKKKEEEREVFKDSGKHFVRPVIANLILFSLKGCKEAWQILNEREEMKRRWSNFKAHFPAGPPFLVKNIRAGKSFRCVNGRFTYLPFTKMINKTSERKISLLVPAWFLVGGPSNGLHLFLFLYLFSLNELCFMTS